VSFRAIKLIRIKPVAELNIEMQLSSLLPATLRTVVATTPKCMGTTTAAAAFSTTSRNMDGYRVERDTFGELQVRFIIT
jgi:hypothetical protein